MSTNEVLKYLENLPEAEKMALTALRRQILTLVPGMEERLSRGVPFFYHKGKRAVGFRSSKTHLSFFIMEGKVLRELSNEGNKLDLSSTVIRFQADRALPKELIERLVLARVQEIDSSLR